MTTIQLIETDGLWYEVCVEPIDISEIPENLRLDVDDDIVEKLMYCEYVVMKDKTIVKRPETTEEQITNLKLFLTKTDYVAIKIAEADEDEAKELRKNYSDILNQRKQARIYINQLEKK